MPIAPKIDIAAEGADGDVEATAQMTDGPAPSKD